MSQLRSLADPTLTWVQSSLPPCPQTINVYGPWVRVWVCRSWNSSLLVCWLCGGPLGLSKDWASIVGLGPRAGGPSLACYSEPICPCRMPGQGLAALKQTIHQPSPAVFRLAGGHCALMHAVCSHATLVKVNRQIAAYTAVQMEYSIKAWVLPLRASTRSPWACPLQCRGPKNLYLKPDFP